MAEWRATITWGHEVSGRAASGRQEWTHAGNDGRDEHSSRYEARAHELRALVPCGIPPFRELGEEEKVGAKDASHQDAEDLSPSVLGSAAGEESERLDARW